MHDFVPLGTGNSRFLKSVENFKALYPTYDDFVAALVAGTLPVDFNGVNEEGVKQKGTAINANTLLKHATAALFGLGEDAVPDEALALIGKYNKHWWRRTSLVPTLVGEKVAVTDYEYVLLYYKDGTTTATVYAADEYVINQETGEIELVNPETINIYGNSSSLDGKWISPASGVKFYSAKYRTSVASYAVEIQGPILWPGSTGSSSYIIDTTKTVYTLNVISELQIGTVDYVQSIYDSTYPHSGDDGYFEYEYLGVPLENAVTAPNFAYGSYTGTNTYGIDNPNSLTFDFVPKFLVIQAANTNAYTYWGIWAGSATFSNSQSNSKYVPNVTVSGNTVSWYNTQSAQYQFNINAVYVYFAIG